MMILNRRERETKKIQYYYFEASGEKKERELK